MESTGLYLLKSAVWLTGFTLVFLTVLRNERYFRLNRIYLLSGIVASVAFPFYTWHYAVILPTVQVAFTTTSSVSAVATVVPVSTTIPIYWWLYLVGIAGLALRMIWQTGMVVRKLRKTGYVKTGSVKLVRTAEYAASFSFFSFVFVNPSTSDIETKEIVNHEREHILQRHWFDLLLVELLCMLQWFNPFVWIYARLIRQNHEYLADEMALQHSSNPAIYQATLLNQMLGAPVISLANSFSYSLNKKRFKMMKKKIDSPFRKLRMLLVLPLVAMIFYAFAKPEYINPTNTFPTDKVNVNTDGNDVKGKVVKADGKPLHGTSVIVSGTTIGTIADIDGNFKLNSVPTEAKIAFSFVGFKTVMQKQDFNQQMTITMVADTVKFEKGVVAVGYGPKPPVTDSGSGAGKNKLSDSANPPLFIVDGKIIDKSKFDKINTDDFESMEVFKDKSATDKYGEKGKYGVVLVTLKKVPAVSSEKENVNTKADVNVNVNAKADVNVSTNAKADVNVRTNENAKADVIVNSKSQQTNKEVFVVVEQMADFPGGKDALMKFIAMNIKYPAEAQKVNVQGKVFVTFVVNSNGKVENAKVIRGVHPALDAEAIRVVNSMPDWKPGKQRGTAVDIAYTMPIEFKLQ